MMPRQNWNWGDTVPGSVRGPSCEVVGIPTNLTEGLL